MNTCPVCSTKNHHLNVTCSACGGYVQGRVDNLDLFSTIWRLIENPRRMFLSISLARYKNYSTIVPAIAGIGLVFMLFWFIKAGDYTPSALNLLAGGTVLGPAVGVVTLLVLAGGVFLFLTLARVTVRFRNLYAVLAYAFVPVMLSVFFILPLKIFFFNEPPALADQAGVILCFSRTGGGDRRMDVDAALHRDEGAAGLPLEDRGGNCFGNRGVPVRGGIPGQEHPRGGRMRKFSLRKTVIF